VFVRGRRRRCDPVGGSSTPAGCDGYRRAQTRVNGCGLAPRPLGPQPDGRAGFAWARRACSCDSSV
jgi:hypothetical protein